jgi:hypothetical protein
MTVSELLQWQWQGYTRYHQTRTNLLLHLVVVPLFLVGHVGVVVALFQASWAMALASIGAMVLSVAAQGRGHAMEPVPSVPFTSKLNAVQRIFFEQWVTFPRFVLSGGWARAWRQSSKA